MIRDEACVFHVPGRCFFAPLSVFMPQALEPPSPTSLTWKKVLHTPIGQAVIGRIITASLLTLASHGLHLHKQFSKMGKMPVIGHVTNI